MNSTFLSLLTYLSFSLCCVAQLPSKELLSKPTSPADKKFAIQFDSLQKMLDIEDYFAANEFWENRETIEGKPLSKRNEYINQLIWIEIHKNTGRKEMALTSLFQLYNDLCLKDKQENCEICVQVELQFLPFLHKNNNQFTNYLLTDILDRSCLDGEKHSKLNTGLAHYYVRLGELDKALSIMQNHITKLEAGNDINYSDLIEAYNYQGQIRYYLEDHEEGIRSMQKAIGIAREQNVDTSRIAEITGNISACYWGLNELDSAFKYNRIDRERSLQSNNRVSYIFAAIFTARLEMYVGNTKEAIRWCEHVLEDYPEIKSGKWPGAHLALLRRLSKLHRKLGDYKTSMQYLDDYLGIRDSMDILNRTDGKLFIESYSDMLIANIESENKLREQELQVALGEKELEKERKERNFVLISAISVALILILLLLNIRVRSKKRELTQKLEIENLNTRELKLSEKLIREQLKIANLEVSYKNDIKKHLLDHLNGYNQLPVSEKNNLKLFIENELLIRSTTGKMNAVSDEKINFLVDLKRKHPNLSEKDVELSSFITMGYSNKEMSIRKNITIESVKSAKKRLKKKLNLSANESLADYLIQFLNDDEDTSAK